MATVQVGNAIADFAQCCLIVISENSFLFVIQGLFPPVEVSSNHQVSSNQKEWKVLPLLTPSTQPTAAE